MGPFAGRGQGSESGSDKIHSGQSPNTSTSVILDAIGITIDKQPTLASLRAAEMLMLEESRKRRNKKMKGAYEACAGYLFSLAHQIEINKTRGYFNAV
jgi:hypothetical protein